VENPLNVPDLMPQRIDQMILNSIYWNEYSFGNQAEGAKGIFLKRPKNRFIKEFFLQFSAKNPCQASTSRIFSLRYFVIVEQPI
jgi:hypothetical protein